MKTRYEIKSDVDELIHISIYRLLPFVKFRSKKEDTELYLQEIKGLRYEPKVSYAWNEAWGEHDIITFNI